MDKDQMKKQEEMLNDFQSKEYTKEDINNAEQTANQKYKKKLSSDVWNKVRMLFYVIRHPSLWDKKYIAIAVAAVMYLVLPIDVIPDLIPVAGLTDDAAAIGAAIASLLGAMKSFSSEKKSKIREDLPDDLKDFFDSQM